MMSTRPLAVRPFTLDSRWITIMQVVFSSLLIAFCAQIRIQLPFTPVPITLQTLAVMIVGGMLGSRKGALCLMLYLSEAMLGLPVLSGGRVDPLFLLSPVGGYLIGFVVQAYLVGWFIEKIHSIGHSMMLLGLGISCAVQLGCGSLYLAFFVGAQHAFSLGFAPFIPGEVLKVALAAAYFNRHLEKSN